MRFLRNKRKEINIADGNDKFQDEFLNPNEFQEMKNIYSDCNIGDIVIVFPNPDDEESVQKGVTF